ncbi:TROVE domain-containing protein [Calothrix sp. NIES-4071]|nr:TROVE domain-containing protein [Calothrix sp. NIES-4071]BAZ56339.1 TROVE domain-containing protein [Calothrix sp. NIES-4105]
MTYKFFLNQNNKNQNTPQSQAIPRREAEMIQGRSGGYMFKADLWQVLRRCLLIGTSQNTYYAGKHELTNDFVDTLFKAIAENPKRVASEIVYASDGG